MNKVEYIIVGDTEKYKDCLIYSCGKSKERANEVLNRMLTSPTENDKKLMQSLKDIRIEEVPQEDCFWNDSY